MIYWIFLFVMLFLSFMECFGKVTYKNKKILLFIITVIWAVLSAIRTNVAGDYINYKDNFETMCDASSIRAILFPKYRYFELFYHYLMGFTKIIIPSFVVFQFIEYILVGWLQYKTILFFGRKIAQDNRSNGYEFTAYFILWGLYIGNIFIIRNTIAVWICMYALRYIEEKKWIRFIFLVIIAMLFHRSALIFICAYPIYYAKGNYNKKFLSFIIASGIGIISFWRIVTIAAAFLPGQLGQKVSSYVEGDVGTGVSVSSITVVILKAVVNIAVLLLVCYMVYKRSKKYQLKVNGYINIYMLGSIVYLSTMFQSFAFARLAIYFNTIQIVILMTFMKCYRKTKNMKWYWIIFAAYIMLRFVVNLYVGQAGYLPFQTIWSNNQ